MELKLHSNYGKSKRVRKLIIKLLFPHTIKKIIPNQYIDCKLDYDKVEFNPDGILYKGIKAKKIVFCEGISEC